MKDIIIIYQTEEQIEGLTVTPPQTDGTDFMCLCRCEEMPTNITVLGTYDEVFADESKKAVYDRIYPPTFQYIDEDGEIVTATKPEKFGVFA